jgi:hypothetical protein
MFITIGENRRRVGRKAYHRRGVFGGVGADGEFDVDQLESLMVAAFELLGKPEDQARELTRAILEAAERPQSGDPGNPHLDS